MPTICGNPHVPRDVRITTPRRLQGSGPRMVAKPPFCVGSVSAGICDIFVMACISPPCVLSTAAIMMTMPKSMMMPWMKSLRAVALYPPHMT